MWWMVTVGSITREAAAERFPFLAAKVSGRRRLIKDFTHRNPDFVFWVYPDGRLHDARRSHRDNVPRGYEHILDNEPDYDGFLRGRVASLGGNQLVVVYCRPEALAAPGPPLDQLLAGLDGQTWLLARGNSNRVREIEGYTRDVPMLWSR